MPCATHHTSVVLEVKEDTVASPPGLALADNDGGHNLLSELRLSLLDGGHDHVTDTTGGQTVEARTNTLDGDDVEVTGAGVVAAVHDRTAVSSQFTSFTISNRQFRHRCTIFEEREGDAGQTYTGRPRVILSLLPCLSVSNLLCRHVAQQLVIAVVGNRANATAAGSQEHTEEPRPRLEAILSDYGEVSRGVDRVRRRELSMSMVLPKSKWLCGDSPTKFRRR